VWSGRDDGDCGVAFELGERVGVVLRRNGDRYTTNICGGVWLPYELRAPGALAAPTGSGPVALVATGRTGDAIIASYDAEGTWPRGVSVAPTTSSPTCASAPSRRSSSV